MKTGTLTNTFVTWCTSQGISAPLLQLETAADSNYRFMTAVQEIKTSAELVRVPLTACLTGESLEVVADKLLFEKEKGDRSTFAPYFDMLPTLKDFQSMPRFWTPERLESVSDGGELKRRMAKDSPVREGDPWAMACVCSRSNFLNDMSYSMTPLLDMLNHDCTVRTSAKVSKNKLDEDDKWLSLQIEQCYRDGDQVFISYGSLSNLETLCDYGFVDRSNSCNFESIQVQMIRRPPVTLTVLADGSVDPAAKAVLRREFASGEDLDMLNKEGALAALRPLSERNERDMFAFLATLIAEAGTEASQGAIDAAFVEDDIVQAYLTSRSVLLQKAIARIEERFPGIEF
jgi:hypothetical protein